MTTQTQTKTALETLAAYVAARGPVAAVRVSSAQARGAAKRYAYWGAVRYEIRARKSDGALTAVALERASSDRRSYRLAEQDAERIADSEERLDGVDIGVVSEATAARVCRWLGLATGATQAA